MHAGSGQFGQFESGMEGQNDAIPILLISINAKT